MSSTHLGIWLLTLGFITKRQLTQAIEAQRETQLPLDELLIQQRVLAREEVQGAMALQEDLASVAQLQDLAIDDTLLALVPRPVAMREQVLPLRLIGQRLIIAHARQRQSPEDVNRLFDYVSQVTGHSPHGIGFPPENLTAALSHFYDPSAAHKLVARAVQQTPGSRGAATATRTALEVASPAADAEAPMIELVNKILTQAVEIGASDLHLRSNDRGLSVQARVDGVILPLHDLPREVESAVFARLKIMAELNIAERRRPQDGRCSIMVGGKPVDLRIACISSHWGEMMVLRILRPLNVPKGLSSLGFRGPELERWQRIINAPNGLILVTGPTGSGKTSTLYATLNTFDRRENNILTVEDPVEYPVGGIGQIQVLPQVGLTFAAALRSILRLDPDVILIGEIRDHETLEIALEAAMTGHLVLSTLHTNDAVSAIGRLIEMGAPRHQVASTVVGVLAQRLVRRVCPHCCKLIAASDAEREFLGIGEDQSVPMLAQGAGCDTCNSVGYKGMMAVYEILETDAAFSELINRQASTHDLWHHARTAGMASLLDDGKAKVLAQQTTASEIQRVIGFRDRMTP